MLVLEVTEFHMQIEVNNDALRLRLKQRRIKCLQVTAADLDVCQHEFENECPDCGDCIVCCRCCPGEG
ncbi:MAG: hypothetical protein H8E66_00965 [Planctomycetes bacterium]|nr:hypothetical protein [Planctomycetota bacterium]